MRPAILITIFLFLTISLKAAEGNYSRDITKWQEIGIPGKSDQGARTVWSHAANYSNHEWRVFTKGGKPQAQLITESSSKRLDGPRFTPKAGNFTGAFAFKAVDNGWLISFNQGEFGAALYWFNQDGQRSYKLSDHQVVDFFSLSNGVHAIEGISHLGISEGSVIHISRTNEKTRWQATSVVKLPSAPYAVSQLGDATFITLSDSLVSIGSDGKIQTLLSDVPWGGLYPNSSDISLDEQKLYIGMRQFVGEFDLTTKKLRLLIPSMQFLHKLPKEEEDRIRKQYSN